MWNHTASYNQITEQWIFKLEDREINRDRVWNKQIRPDDIREVRLIFSPDSEYFLKNFIRYSNIPYFRIYLKALLKDLWKFVVDEKVVASLRYDIASNFLKALDLPISRTLKEEFRREQILLMSERLELARQDIKDIERIETATISWMDQLYDLNNLEIDEFCDREEEMENTIFENKEQGKAWQFLIQKEKEIKILSKIQDWFRMFYNPEPILRLQKIIHKSWYQFNTVNQGQPSAVQHKWWRRFILACESSVISNLDKPFVTFPRIFGVVFIGWLFLFADYQSFVIAFKGLINTLFNFFSHIGVSIINSITGIIIFLFLLSFFLWVVSYRFLYWEIRGNCPFRSNDSKKVEDTIKKRTNKIFVWTILVSSLFGILCYFFVGSEIRDKLITESLPLKHCWIFFFFVICILFSVVFGLFAQVLWSEKPITTRLG